jgi:transcriptional regulator with XRE-family HTH domain
MAENVSPNDGDATATIRPSFGEALRERRRANHISVRALAAQVGVSPSLVSQIENGKVNPSVDTLVALVTALGLSLDELFLDVPPKSGEPLPQPGGTGVVRAGERPRIELATGVKWDRLTPTHEHGVDFLYVVYEVGGASCAPGAYMRHHGREYGIVLSGRLGAAVGFETFELGPGDSIVFNADTPHRLWTIGDEPATATWTIIGRSGDERGSFSD